MEFRGAADFFYRGENSRVGARDQNILDGVFAAQHGAHNLGDLSGRLPLTENHFREALAQGAMMIYFREAKIFVWEMPQSFDGAVRGEFS